MSGGREPVSAEVWLLDAPDSLAVQSHRNPDGTGLGTFDANGRPIVHKQPIAAYSDAEFAFEARRQRSRTFLGHVRFATSGALTLANTHPFEQERRLFAHNGVLSGLPQLETELGADLALVKGQTDSERLFALITRETQRHDGDLRAGIVAAVEWVAANLPIYSLNLIITTESELFALRYPDGNTLYVLERGAGGVSGAAPLRHCSSLGTRLRSDDAAHRPIVVLASEPMDDDPGWRALQTGELLHVDDRLRVKSTIAFPHPPAHPMTLGSA
ncbi:MAG TPA: class II glutamine amidotransferase [Solirubrobacteraceae bacterium]|jgi:glutamine amidotransferase|nr:class II glutamine amidotransferase [Solirubrobacteraceae bacterium]